MGCMINNKPGTCVKCKGSGLYNNRYACYSCAGTGKQDRDRMRRNEYYRANHTGRNQQNVVEINSVMQAPVEQNCLEDAGNDKKMFTDSSDLDCIQWFIWQLR